MTTHNGWNGNLMLGYGPAAAAAAMSAMDYTMGNYHRQNNVFNHSCILELRKEKSRDAARSRRGKENYEFYELAKLLPLPPAITSQLDKASIIRLTISYLKLRDFSAQGEPPWTRDNASDKKLRSHTRGNSTLELFEQHQGTHILQSLDGFAFALGSDGRFLYVSETVSIYLGLSQVELTGSSVFDYIHHQDHAELAEQLGLGLASSANNNNNGGRAISPHSDDPDDSSLATNNPDVTSIMSMSSNSAYKGMDRCFCIRMKSTLTKRGCHFKSSGYRVVLVLCRLRPQCSFSQSRKSTVPLLGMIALAIALPPPSVHEIRLESDMFVTRMAFDFKIIHSEHRPINFAISGVTLDRVTDWLGYTPESLVGRNLYSIIHAGDVSILRKCHLDLLSKGQSMSGYYRVLNKSGGVTRLQTCATVVNNTKTSDEQSIICVNYVVSVSNDPSLLLDTCQMDMLPVDVRTSSTIIKTEVIVDKDGNNNLSDETSSLRSDAMNEGTACANAPPTTSSALSNNNSSSIITTSTASNGSVISTNKNTISSVKDMLEKKDNDKSSSRKRKRKKMCNLDDNEDDHDDDHKFINNDSSHEKAFSDQPRISSRSSLASPQPSNQQQQQISSSSSSSPRSPTIHSYSKSPPVKQLEQVMSKHLREHTSDFSADSLLRQQPSIGSHHQHVHHHGGSGNQHHNHPRNDPLHWNTNSSNEPQLPVSALLRQICSSRESVIRQANVAVALSMQNQHHQQQSQSQPQQSQSSPSTYSSAQQSPSPPPPVAPHIPSTRSLHKPYYDYFRTEDYGTSSSTQSATTTPRYNDLESGFRPVYNLDANPHHHPLPLKPYPYQSHGYSYPQQHVPTFYGHPGIYMYNKVYDKHDNITNCNPSANNHL